MKNKFLILFFLLFVAHIFSCKQEPNYFSIPKSYLDYTININDTKVDTSYKYSIKYEDTTYLNITFKEDLDISELVLSIPSRVICDIYFNGEYFNSNKHECIYNAEEEFIDIKKGFPISPENTNVKLVFRTNKTIKKGDRFSFIIFKSPIYMDKIRAIEFYSKKNVFENNKPKTLEIETKDYLLESELPVIKINTEKRLYDNYYVYGNLEIFEKSKDLFKDKADKETNIKIKIRGQSSKYYRKQSYKFTSIKTDSTNNNIKLLGLPKENDWILYAPYWDESLIRNNIVFQLWREMGYYSPRTKYVELVVNNDYRGIYVLTEKIKIDKNRLNLNKLSKKDTSKTAITGGYVFKLDKGRKIYWPSEFAENGYSRCYYYVSPTYRNINDKQRKYINNYVSNFEKALYNDINWNEYINEQSFIDFLIINELAKNIDSYRLSTYMSKDKNGKLEMGPIWDFDRAFGNDNKEGANKFDGFIYELKFIPFWWTKLMNNKEFKHKLIQRYKELRKTTLSDNNINLIINYNYNIIKPSIEREATRWRTYIKNEGNPYNAKSFDEAVWYLKDWLNKRINYLDKQWNY